MERTIVIDDGTNTEYEITDKDHLADILTSFAFVMEMMITETFSDDEKGVLRCRWCDKELLKIKNGEEHDNVDNKLCPKGKAENALRKMIGDK